MTVNLQRAVRQGSYFQDELGENNTSSALWLSLTNLAVLNNGTNADIVATNIGNALIAQTPQTFTYDADGNLTSDGLWTNTWNAENRLIATESSANVPPAARKREEWSYLPDGRWTQRIVSIWNTNTLSYQPSTTNRFVWDGQVLIAILDSQSSILVSFLRGLDVSGSMQGAGGVGGLLAVSFPANGTHFAAFDGNGNVAALVNAADGTVSANYEYDPFGQTLRMTGPVAKLNPIRFSTQFADDVTGNLKYLYRDYTPSTGRWPNRDPIEEAGGKNLYGFVGNAPCFKYDLLGMKIEAASCTLDEYLKTLGFVLGTDYTRKYVGDDSLYTGFTATKTGEGEAVIIQQMMRSDYVFKVPGKKRADVEKNIKENVATRLRVISNARGLKTGWGDGTFATMPSLTSDDPAVWQAWYDANNNRSVSLYCRKSTFLAFYGAIGGPSHELERTPPERIMIPGDWYFIRNVAFDQDPGWNNVDATFAGENTIVVGLNATGDGILWGLMGSSVERPLQDWNADIIQNWQRMSGAKTPANPQPAWTKSPMNGLGK